MKYEEGALVPIITESEDPYMILLYERLGAGNGGDPQQVLDCAETAWAEATDLNNRLEAAEILMGRRIPGSEAKTLPFELVAILMEGGEFEAAYNGIARAIEIGQA